MYKLVQDEIQGCHQAFTIMQKLKQNENVAKTIGHSMIFEGHIPIKNGIVKIRLEFVSVLAPQNRHVRGTTGIMQRAERYKIKEICVK